MVRVDERVNAEKSLGQRQMEAYQPTGEFQVNPQIVQLPREDLWQNVNPTENPSPFAVRHAEWPIKLVEL